MIEFIKREHIIDIAGVALTFILFGNAGTNEDQNRIGILLAKRLQMCIRDRCKVMLFSPSG